MAKVTPSLGEEQYVISNRKEIIQVLNDLVKHKTMVKVSFNGGNDDYVTTIIEVDTESNLLYLDIGRDENFNKRLLASDYLLFIKESGVKIKWASNRISLVELPDGRAVEIDLPENLIRLQRRDYFRLATPMVNPHIVKMPLGDEDLGELEQVKPDPKASLDPVTKTLTLALADISLGGLGVVAIGPLSAALQPGANYENCQLFLPEIEPLNMTLQVRSIVQVPMRDGSLKHRIGLMYVKLPRSVEGQIQRFTFDLERELCSRAWSPMG